MYYIINRDKNLMLILCNIIVFLLDLKHVCHAGTKYKRTQRRGGEQEKGRESEGKKQILALGRFLTGF
jgi:hypothetical protein